MSNTTNTANKIFSKANILAGLAVVVLYYVFDLWVQDVVIPAIMREASKSSDLVVNFLLFIFIVCSIIMVILIYWLSWDNKQMKSKITNYVSQMVCEDYYREKKKIDFENAVGSVVAANAPNKIQVDGSMNDGKIVGTDKVAAQPKMNAEDGTYIKGKFTGIRRTFFPNGKLYEETPYDDDLIHGTLQRFYEHGKLHHEKNFKHGKLDGVYRAFDEDGSLFFEINYKDDKQHGTDKIYYKSGAIQYEDTYFEGVKQKRKTFDEAGNLKFEQDFHH